jgi:SAM-dependent methyltransferase
VRTRLTPQNPHGYDRHGFAWEHVLNGGEAYLDFGCYEGAFLHSLGGKGIAWLVGVEISRDAVATAHRRFPGLEVIHISKGVPLPFAAGTFSSIAVLDVIEHVHEQTALLDELNRVLQGGGPLIVTVPGRHVFSVLDLGKLKFRFPRLHRWFYLRDHPVEEYERRYLCNPDGLIGDISAEKRWHEHFSMSGLDRLLRRSGFDAVEFDGAGFFERLISPFDLALQRIGPVRRLLRRLVPRDARWFASANLFCVARRSGMSPRRRRSFARGDLWLRRGRLLR